jgi:hypothetical protein
MKDACSDSMFRVFCVFRGSDFGFLVETFHGTKPQDSQMAVISGDKEQND